MPFYEYVCPACGHKETAMRKVAERDVPGTVVCTHEGLDLHGVPVPQPMVRNTVTAPAFHLKGKGWASDGYGGK